MKFTKLSSISLFLIGLSCGATQVRGATIQWLGGDDAWEVPANWETDETVPVNRVPVDGDGIQLSNAGTVTYSATTGTTNLPNSDLGQSTSGAVVIQTGGTLNVNAFLLTSTKTDYAAGRINYELRGGSLYADYISTFTWDNRTDRASRFLQTGGSATFGQNTNHGLNMANKANTQEAYYDLDNGTFDAGFLRLGSGGANQTAIFTQSGGDATIRGSLHLGERAGTTGQSIYNLDGGTLTMSASTAPFVFTQPGAPAYFDFDSGTLNLIGTWDFASLTAIPLSDFRVGGVAATTGSLDFTPVTIDSESYTQITSSPVPIYVDALAGFGGDGSSWAGAYRELQDALAAAVSTDRIWVAQGTYQPDQGSFQIPSDANSTFNLINGVAIYGGFPNGGGDGSFAARDLAAHPTILSGQFSGAGRSFEKAYHVVTAGPSVIPSALLDGFTITAGHARFPAANPAGGGLLCNGGSPTIANCTFSGNISDQWGGAISANGPSLQVINCVFSNNSADLHGGAIYTNVGNPSLINCHFSGNSANQGGAVYNMAANPSFMNCSFSGNSAGAKGGAIYKTGPSILTALTNCILWNNRAAGVTTTPEASFYAYLASDPTYSHCLVQNIDLSGTGINNLDGTDPANAPLFLLPVNPATAPTTAGDLRLSSGSPVLERGLNSAVTAGTDLDGNARIQGCLVDLGAYEHATNIPAYYCTWIAIQFPAETDPDIIGFLADPNGDGVSNGLAFITGYLANAIAHDALGIITDTGGFMSIEFKEMDAAAPLNHSIVASFDLLTWLPVASISPHVTVVANSGPGFTQTIVESDKTQVPHLFLRQTFDAFPAP